MTADLDVPSLAVARRVRAAGAGTQPHPVAALARRLDGAVEWLTFRQGEQHDGRWRHCSDVLEDPGALPSWLQQVREAVTRQQGGTVPPLVVPATYLMAWYLDVPAYAGGLAFGAARRVPDLDPAALAVRVHPDGYPEAIALLGRRFACLPDDPAAGHPDAEVVADEAALAAVLRRRVAAHTEAFHAVYAPGVKIGSRQRWGTATDKLDTALWASGRLRGDETLGVADAALVLDGQHPPFTAPTGMYRVADASGRRWWSRRRQACCFFYRLPGTEACFTCPRTSDAERSRRAALWPDTGPC